MEYDIIILGGGVAGLTAAMYASRSGANTLLLEESFIGGTTATLERVENFPGIPNMNGMEFVTNLYSQALTFGASIQIAKVTHIDFKNRIISSSIGDVSYNALIIATGSTYKKLNVAGELELNQKGVSYCAVCDGALYKNKKVVVVTDGLSATSTIDYLENITNDITILDLSNSFKSNTFDVYNNISINQINGVDYVESIDVVLDKNIKNIKCDGIFINIGKVYNIDLYNDVIDTNDGFIVTNNNFETNINNVFAVGDIRYNSTKQIICACGEGAAAALNAIKNIKK